MLGVRVAPGQRRKKFPCRGGESIRRRSTSTLSNRRLDIPLPSVPRFERIIIGGTRTQEPSRERERERRGGLRVYSNARKKVRLRVPARSLLSTPRWRSHGAPLPYDFHVSASGPPKLHDQALYLT